MRIEDQVVSLDLARKLKRLGFKKESYHLWHKDGAGEWYLTHMTATFDAKSTWLAAYSVAELGEILMDIKFSDFGVFPNQNNGVATYPGAIFKINYGIRHFAVSGKTEADSRARMLIYLKENNLI